jgi:hypothetical protein
MNSNQSASNKPRNSSNTTKQNLLEQTENLKE